MFKIYHPSYVYSILLRYGVLISMGGQKTIKRYLVNSLARASGEILILHQYKGYLNNISMFYCFMAGTFVVIGILLHEKQ